MTIEVEQGRATNVAAWSGWDADMLDALLDGESGPPAIGFTLARVLATRLLPSPAARFRFRLYRYCHEDGSYRFVGAWNERCLEEDAAPQPSEQLERQEALVHPPIPEVRTEQFHDDELFLPLETKSGVLGFGVLRVDSQHEPSQVTPQDLHFLGRLGGSALGRLNESDRAERMHRSFESASRHLDAVLSMTNEAFVVVDGPGIVRIASDPARELLAPSGGELPGRSITDTVPREVVISLERTLHDAEETGRLVLARIELAHNGGVQPFEVAVQRLQADIDDDPTLLVRFRSLADVTGATDPECASLLGGEESRRRAMRETGACPPLAGSEVPRAGLFGRESAFAADEAEALRRHVRLIRGYLGLLRGEIQPRSQSVDIFRQLEAQLEWLQGEADVHALLESIRTGDVTWQCRSVRVEALIERAIDRVGARLALRGVEVGLEIGPGVGRIRLDPEKWALALAVLIDHATDDPSVRRLDLNVSTSPDLSFTIELTAVQHRSDPLVFRADQDDRVHGVTLVRHMVDLHGATLRTAPAESRESVICLCLPITADLGRTHDRVA